MNPETLDQHLRFIIGFAAFGYTHQQAVNYVAAMHPELLAELPAQREYDLVMYLVNQSINNLAKEIKSKMQTQPR